MTSTTDRFLPRLDIHARVEYVRDMLVPRHINDSTTLASYMRALSKAERYLEDRPRPYRREGHWVIRGSVVGKGEGGQNLYAWHMATMHSCTCSSFYAGQDGPQLSTLICEHQMVAWLLSVDLSGERDLAALPSLQRGVP